jgi:hypothetical protein
MGQSEASAPPAEVIHTPPPITGYRGLSAADVAAMNEIKAKASEVETLIVRMRASIRAHRDAEGHNLCWYVPELWNLLPEKVTPKPKVPPRGEFLANCAIYRDSLTKKT